ncbi:MAG: MFS transporter [Desulfobacterota bacterium]|nr:MFS transporter [Thermodesulfobacteriota bacterium]
MKHSITPWLYIPTLYLAESIPYAVVNSASVIMYKNLGMSNTFIGYTSMLYLPWVVKMLWSPAVDIWGTKRTWILLMQGLLSILCALLACSLMTGHFVMLSLAILIIIALCSATNDIATDGYYMLALDHREQALFIGVRSTCYRIGLIVAGGVFVMLAGKLETMTGSVTLGWSWVMAVCAVVFAGFLLFHRRMLPHSRLDTTGTPQTNGQRFAAAFVSYFQQPRIGVVLAFILVYRLGEALLLKMAAPFLLDSPAAGGLGLATDTVGFVSGTVGVIGMCGGGIIGGWAIARWGLKRCLWPMAIMLNVPNLCYVYLAAAHPSLPTVATLVVAEQLGYGFGFSGFAVFLMEIAQEPYKTSHFAISTGFMALGMMLPGVFSGMLQGALGYYSFFILVALAGIPGCALVPLLPINKKKE